MIYFFLVSNRITYTVVQHDLHIRWCCRLIVTWRVSLVEQELLTLPDHLNTPPRFLWVRVGRSLVFCGVFCISLLVLFLLAIVLSVLLRFTASDWLFGIFKCFLFNVSNNYILKITSIMQLILATKSKRYYLFKMLWSHSKLASVKNLKNFIII